MSLTSAPFSQSPEIQSLRDAVSCRLSSLVASLVNRTHTPASAGASPTSAISGKIAGESFGTYDPSLPSSRTLEDCSVPLPLPRMVSLSADFFSTAFCQTWPRFGTLANGTLYRQPTLARRTDAKESGLSALTNSDWPTPAVFDTTGGPYPTELTQFGFRSFHNGVPHGTKLADAVRVEPTRSGPPRTDSGPPVLASGNTDGSQAESWSTPQQGDYRSPNLNPGARGTSESAINGLLPQSEHALPAQAGGKLNPAWVETLMGLPMGWTQLPHKFTKPKRETP